MPTPKPKTPRKPRKTGPKTTPGSLHQARTLKEWALAELRRLELDLKKGRLAPPEEYEKAWGAVLTRLRDAIISFDLDEHKKASLLWILSNQIAGNAGPPPPPRPPTEAPVHGHHDWEAYGIKHGNVPEGIGDHEFQFGLDPLPRPWFFNADTGGGMTPDEIKDARSTWLRTAPGAAYLRACEQSTTRAARLKAERKEP